MKSLKILLPAIIILVISCEPEIEMHNPVPGEADFSVYVAMGNSLTAGYTDLELFRSGQEHSFANMLSDQLKHVGLNEFNQPLMYDDLGFGNRLVLGHISDCTGQRVLSPVPAGGQPFPGNFTWLGNDTPIHNLGIPGAKAKNLLQNGYGLANPYFGRFAINPQTSSPLEDAMSLNPTFFTLWIGNNDILGFATSGGTSGSVTPEKSFNTSYNELIIELTSFGAKGAIGNIPFITDIAFFNTIPYNGLILENQQQVDALNAAYSQVPDISFSLGPNPFVVSDPNHSLTLRQLNEGELVLLSIPQDSIKCAGWGSQKPIPLQFYLSAEDVNQINETTVQYNEHIKQYSEQYNLALVDLNLLLEDAKSGFYYNGLNFSTEYLTGGIFSIDGIHLSRRGNALVTNMVIDAVNSTYGSTIPRVTVSSYDGIIFP